MKIGLFGGSFDPVHSQHVALAQAARAALSLDRVIVIPSAVAPHKAFGAMADGEARLSLCRAAFENIAEVSDFEVRSGGTSYSYVTCEAFAAKYPEDELFFLVGADMLENFYVWREPERILARCTLAVCGRGETLPADAHRKFVARFGVDFAEIPFVGKAVSSTGLRVALAFGKRPAEMPPAAYAAAAEHKLYSHPAILPALSLETEERREHSYRVAKLACMRKAGIEEARVLLASALHDCGKSVPLTSPLLEGFVPPDDVPAPVMHQFTGAYLAERAFGIGDREVLDAIRYHTSGRAGMGGLEILVYLSDLLEEGRSFGGVEELRALFQRDLSACLLAALEQQTAYLAARKQPIYPLTMQAYEWAKSTVKR